MQSDGIPSVESASFVRVQHMDTSALTCAVLALFDAPEDEDAPAADESQDHSAVSVYISQVLLHLGIQPHAYGYRLIRQAIQMTLDNESTLDSLSRTLYPALAQKFNISSDQAAHAIRSAISNAWKKSGPEAFDKLRPHGCIDAGLCPTIREFLALVSERIRLKMPGP